MTICLNIHQMADRGDNKGDVMNGIAMTIYFVCFLWLLSGIDLKLKAILEELKNRRRDDKNDEN